MHFVLPSNQPASEHGRNIFDSYTFVYNYLVAYINVKQLQFMRMLMAMCSVYASKRTKIKVDITTVMPTKCQCVAE